MLEVNKIKKISRSSKKSLVNMHSGTYLKCPAELREMSEIGHTNMHVTGCNTLKLCHCRSVHLCQQPAKSAQHPSWIITTVFHWKRKPETDFSTTSLTPTSHFPFSANRKQLWLF